MLMALLVGVTIGAIAGISRGARRRGADVAHRPVPVAAAAAAAADPDLPVPRRAEGGVRPEVGVFILIVLVIGGFRWMPVARLVRAQFFSLREKEFVEAARALGASVPRQVVRHILPNSLGPVIVAGTIDVAAAIIAESTLSFLGLGFPPDIPTWGRILYDARNTSTSRRTGRCSRARRSSSRC
jgi:peptide/nickel transport system permease protein